MLVLPIRLGDQAYAVPARDVVEVVPRVALRPVPHAPPVVAGLLLFRGAIVPVVDLRQLLLGEPCASVLSTRILVVAHPADPTRRLGLVAERVTTAVALDESTLSSIALHVEGMPFLGGVATLDHESVQVLRVERLHGHPLLASLLEEHSGGDRAV